MTNPLILDIFQTSLMMSAFILAVFLLSPLLSKRYITKVKYWLWLVIALRLIVPFQLSFTPNSAPVSIPVNDFTVVEFALPQSQPNAEPQAIVDTPATDSVTNPVVNDAVENNTAEQIATETVQQTEIVKAESAAQSQTSATYSLSAIEIAAIVWSSGLSVYLMYHFVAMLRFRGLLKRAKRLSAGSHVYDNVQNIKADMGIKRKIDVLVWDQAPSPFLTGLFARKLVLPTSHYSDSELELVIRHELTHSKHRDLWYKAFLNISNALHWFNPIVYYMKKQAARDLELICDETLIAGKGIDLKKSYGELILQNVEQRRAKFPALSTHMSTNKKTIKKRIKNIMETRLRKKGITVILCVLLGIVLAANLVACNLLAPKQALEGIWIKEMDSGQFAVLTIEEELLRAFYLSTDQAITEENAAGLLSGNPAYFYSYEKTSDSLTLTELDKTDGQVEFSMVLSDGLLELTSDNDRFLLNGQYTFISPTIEDISATNVNDALTQEFMNGIWVHNGASGQGYYHYTILSINSASYSNVLSINTTLDLNTGLFSNDLGFKGIVEDDWSMADTFFNFIVQDNRTMKVELADGAVLGHFASESVYNVVLTNDSILLSSQNADKNELDGYYYNSTVASPSIDGTWVEPFEDDQNREPRYFFEHFENNTITSSSKIFSYDDVIDHSKLQEYYEQSEDHYSYMCTMFEGGQIQFSGICFWPIYVTDKLAILGVSGGPNKLPEYWVPMYKLG